MKRLMTAKSWQPKIVTINEASGGGQATSSDDGGAGDSGGDKALWFPHKIYLGKQAKETDAVIENGLAVGVLTNNNRTTTQLLMTPN